MTSRRPCLAGFVRPVALGHPLFYPRHSCDGNSFLIDHLIKGRISIVRKRISAPSD